MKKKILFISTSFIMLTSSGLAQAALTTIGTATYQGEDYNLIYNDFSRDGGGSVIWLDYTNDAVGLSDQRAWASILNDELAIHINPGYTLEWRATDWSLPYTEGSGVGLDKTDSDFGHLFYTELGNTQGLVNTGPFENLTGTTYYWSGNYINNQYWYFDVTNGMQYSISHPNDIQCYGIARLDAEVTPTPVPGAIWLMGSGIFGLIGLKRRNNKKR